MVQEQHIRTAGDISALSVALTTLIGWLPPIAALASIVWTCIQIIEWYKRKKDK